jgi:hypothetical protein
LTILDRTLAVGDAVSGSEPAVLRQRLWIAAPLSRSTLAQLLPPCTSERAKADLVDRQAEFLLRRREPIEDEPSFPGSRTSQMSLHLAHYYAPLVLGNFSNLVIILIKFPSYIHVRPYS